MSAAMIQQAAMIYSGLIPEIFKILVLNLNRPFLMGNHRFLRIHPMYNFRDFAENGNSDNVYFLEKI